MKVREYGDRGPLVVVLHGGPAAPGEMAPVARELSDRFRVLEPFQRSSGAEPLTVARHVEDLAELIAAGREGAPPAIVGFSWGAMLALAYAAAHAAEAGPVVLVGCGTFDIPARERKREIMDARTGEDLRARLAQLDEEIADPSARLAAQAALSLPLLSHDLLTAPTETETVDARAHWETWDDMMRLQRDGTYPAAFAAIRAPVLMIHGGADPHPGRMILESLAPHVPGIEYVELERCGHYPWLERAARAPFFHLLREWLERHAAAREKTSARGDSQGQRSK